MGTFPLGVTGDTFLLQGSRIAQGKKFMVSAAFIHPAIINNWGIGFTRA